MISQNQTKSKLSLPRPAKNDKGELWIYFALAAYKKKCYNIPKEIKR